MLDEEVLIQIKGARFRACYELRIAGMIVFCARWLFAGHAQ
jgi:hypothetical protein